MTVDVIGEALVDLVHQSADPDGTDRYLAHPGGSPFNVAIGLARLGQHSRLLARLSGTPSAGNCARTPRRTASTCRWR